MMEFVNGKDDIPSYIMENKKCSKPPTRDDMTEIIWTWFALIQYVCICSIRYGADIYIYILVELRTLI